MYNCSKLAVYGTDYKVNQLVLMSETTNNNPVFGRIKGLACCKSYGYLILQAMTSTYCKNTDLYMVTETKKNTVTNVQHLADFRPLEGSAFILVLEHNRVHRKTIYID